MALDNFDASSRAEQNPGSFALVCYVSERQQLMIEALREAIPGKPGSPPHITILPPRLLTMERERACAIAAQCLQGTQPFEAELSAVRRFPETDFLYLDIALGEQEFRQLHSRLNATELRDHEMYEYRPHLTLGGPVARDRALELEKRVARRWAKSDCPRRIHVEEFVCLWLPAGCDEREWRRVRLLRLSAEPGRQNAAAAGTTNRT